MRYLHQHVQAFTRSEMILHLVNGGAVAASSLASNACGVSYISRLAKQVWLSHIHALARASSDPSEVLCRLCPPGWGNTGEEASAGAGEVAVTQQACTKLWTMVSVCLGIPAGMHRPC